MATTTVKSGKTTDKSGKKSYESNVVLPIVQRGPFFQDVFFEHARFHFDAAIRKLLPAVGEADDQLSNERTSNALERYRRLKHSQTVTESQDGHNNKIVLDVHEFRHGDLRVSAVGETEILVEAVSEVPEHEAMQVRKFRQKFLLPETAAATDSIAALSSDGVLAIITPKKDGTTPSIKRKLPEDVETPEKSSKYMTKNDPRSNETEKSTIIDREMVECFLPILQRGNFFTDSIFQETRQDFNTAITEVLDKWGERSVHDPERGTHREEPAEDNQILVDIADFVHDGEVKINVSDEELVVEGRTKKAEGSATSVKTFIRRFTLAPDIDPSAVTSVVTPDGILEITTPKKTVIPKLKEFSIQVIIELIVEESRTSPRKDSKSRKKLKDKSPAKDADSSHSRKKKKTHPEDAMKHDGKQQDAKQQQEQSQELLQQVRDAENSSGSINAGSEANKNKLSSDEAKSLEAEAASQKDAKTSELEDSKDKAASQKKAKASKDKAVSQKEAKASKLEGSKDKLASSSESKAEVSEVSPDIATKDSSTKDQQENATAESSAAGEQQKLANSEMCAAGKLQLSAEQQKLATAESSVAGELKISAEQQNIATAESSVAGEPKLTIEQQKLAAAESSVSGDLKLATEQEKIATAESSVAGELQLSAEQQKLATAESSVTGEPKLNAEQQKLAAAESSVSGELKMSAEIEKLATAESSVSGDLKLANGQQELTTSDSSATSELKSTTEQQKLGTSKDSQSNEDSLKSTSVADISKQSTSQGGAKADLSSSQQEEKGVTSSSKKSAKEKSEKAVSDESVKSKKSTAKKDVSAKRDTDSGKSSSIPKIEIQTSTVKDAKAMFQSQGSASAAGSTSDLRSVGRSTGSSLGLSGTRSMSSSYSQLPGSSSPSSGYLATGTKSIASGSFTFKATEEYVKKKPPPRNRPFFNLRDFL